MGTFSDTTPPVNIAAQEYVELWTQRITVAGSGTTHLLSSGYGLHVTKIA